ncbi:MAG: imidazoleglycerol-phosphate dehydratase HisB [Candidatus Aureabacteria bacterium]|nr:imidazoleglycerol-phosphate dehydratase HisB [Candidatus Auribacterota bacterium]
MSKRTAKQVRKTKETDIVIELDLDKSGNYEIETGIPFMNHMLELLAKHSGINMIIKAKGDTEIDDHHTVEDIGIEFGKTLKEALGDKKGITRYGTSLMIMDEVLVRVVIDISGRPKLVYDLNNPKAQIASKTKGLIKNFDVILIEHFFESLVSHSFITLHIDLLRANNDSDLHHIIEAVFKGFAKALGQAVSLTGDDSVPSTKGMIE